LDGRDKVNGTNGLEHEVADFSSREHVTPPPPKGLIERLEKALAIFSKWATVIAGVALILMLALSIADVVGNKVFNHPVPGASEYLSFLSLLTIAFALAYSMIEKVHVQIDVFVSKLPIRIKASVEAFIALASLGLFFLLGWASVKYGIQLFQSNTLSMTRRIPLYPFAYAVAFACLPACLYLFLEFLRWGKKVVTK
jgi:TRAP-type C4-dicarboxylate transport system permease small subunit